MNDPICIAQAAEPIYLLPKMANRHGLIAGATGTGKTVTLQTLAENFSARGVPVFDIREKFGATNMLVSNGEIGRALAERLGDKAVVLMRGHGYCAVGRTIALAVFRAYYTQQNAELQQRAIERRTAGRVLRQALRRLWWRTQVSAPWVHRSADAPLARERGGRGAGP